MSLLHLLNVDDNLLFDGKSVDNHIRNASNYCGTKFEEDEGELANGTLEDIHSELNNIESLENISNNVDNLVSATEGLLHSHIAVYKILKQISEEASKYCDSDNKQHIQDVLHCLAEQAEDGMNYLNQELNIEIETKDEFTDKFIPYVEFDFIPDSAVLNRSDKSGVVSYTNGDWEFTLGTYVGYGGLRMTPKTIQYRHLDFCTAYDKIVEVGLDPHKISVEDLQLLKILDKDNELIYNLFVK